jgi:hypothetical protein
MVVFSRKHCIYAFLAVLTLLIIFYLGYSRKQNQQRIGASIIAATQFLELIDAGQYEQSWQVSAAYLKNDIPVDEWVKRLSAVRSVAGKVFERKQKSSIYTNEEEVQKGVPAGEYMVYSFALKFQAKNNITETVTVMLEKDNIWRVAGYFID